jgi:hypothetical protein
MLAGIVVNQLAVSQPNRSAAWATERRRKRSIQQSGESVTKESIREKWEEIGR